jgi:hypothetical protein
MRNLHSYVLGIGAAAVLSATLSGCNGASSSLAPPATTMQQSLTQSQPDRGKRKHPAEIINQFNSVPQGPQPTNFEIVLQGNLVEAICGPTNPPCLDQPLYGPYNPFCPPSQGPSNPCYPTVTYNPSTNQTIVTYSGPTLYENIPGHTNYYHFGLFATPDDTTSLKGIELTSYWSYPSSPNNPQPIVSINSKAEPKGATKWAYAEVFVSVATTPNGPAVYGTWDDVAYVPNGTAQPRLSFKNYGKQVLYVLSSGIIPNQPVPSDPLCVTNPSCPEDMQILSILNFAGSPPPGDPSSSFVPLTYPPAKVLKPTKP